MTTMRAVLFYGCLVIFCYRIHARRGRSDELEHPIYCALRRGIRLKEILVRSEVHTALDIVRAVEIGEYNDLGVRGRREVTDDAQRLESVHGGHHDIE